METEVQINKVTYPKVLALKYVTPTGAKLSSKVKKKKKKWILVRKIVLSILYIKHIYFQYINTLVDSLRYYNFLGDN